jgi:hypothetical protein
MTPVVVQEMKLEELISEIVTSAGKDVSRIRETLHRGSQVIGGSRLRWDPIDATEPDVARLLAQFPDPDPGRPFDAQRCEHLVIRGPAAQITIDNESARRRRLFRSRSFWDEISPLTREVTYAGYSYKERADIYRLNLDTARQRFVKEAARLSPFSALVRQIEQSALDSIDFFVKR